jgi:hypothetical protein
MRSDDQVVLQGVVVNKLARAAILVLALLLALLASGCSTPVPGNAAPDALPATTPPGEVEPITNDRGFVPAEVGENSCFGPLEPHSCEGGVNFSIDKIVLDPPCAEWGQRTGHTLVLTLRVATGAHNDSVQLAGSVFNLYSFMVIGADGVSQKAAFGMCTDVADNPDTYGPNQKYAFNLELDVPVAHGTLALQPGVIGLDGSGGWEWPF